MTKEALELAFKEAWKVHDGDIDFYWPEPMEICLEVGCHPLTKFVKNYRVPPLHWNRYTREGRELLRSKGFTVREAWLP